MTLPPVSLFERFPHVTMLPVSRSERFSHVTLADTAAGERVSLVTVLRQSLSKRLSHVTMAYTDAGRGYGGKKRCGKQAPSPIHAIRDAERGDQFVSSLSKKHYNLLGGPI